MFSTVALDGSSEASFIEVIIAVNSENNLINSLSQINALSISFFSSSVVSWYKYLIRSVWVKVFIIGSVFHHFLTQVN
jgi:hypothetical protein